MARRTKKPVLVDVAAIGRIGGLNSRKNFTEEQAADIGRQAVSARWQAYYEKHPEKWKERLEREARKGTVPRGRPAKKKAQET